MAKRSKVKKASPQAAPPKPLSPPEAFEGRGILPSKPAAISWEVVLQAALIIASGLWSYWPSLLGDWIWDDVFYITANPLLNDPARLWKAWFAPGSFVEYYPIEQTAQWLQWQLWGTHTLGYHLTNLALHILSSLLVWRLLGKMGLRLAWLGGLLFAVHPVQVESVAWIVELKNTLSLPPFLLAMCAWVDYDDHHRVRDYALALVLFVAAMLCKISMAPFPALILLYAWWKRGRLSWSDLKASAAFLVLSLALVLTSIRAGQSYSGIIPDPSSTVLFNSFSARLACAGLSLAFYVSKAVLPLGLCAIYPRWPVNPPALIQFLPWPILFGLLGYLWIKRRDWGRHALLGLGFFLLFIAPFIGFISISYMSFSWVMVHFLYIPIIGLIGLAVAGLEAIDRGLAAEARPWERIAVAAIVLAFTWGSHAYAKVFINNETFWTYTVRQNPQAWLAYNNLGAALMEKGQLDQAAAYFNRVLEINSNDPQSHLGLGNILLLKGQLDQAVVEYQDALEIDPRSAPGHFYLGVAYTGKGQTDAAIGQYQEALKINPYYSDAACNLGSAFFDKGQVDDAITYYHQALTNNPRHLLALRGLGTAFLTKRQPAEAIPQFRAALEIEPDSPQTHNYLGVSYLRNGQNDEALAQFQEALRLKPDYVEAQKNITQVQAMQHENALEK